MASKNTYITYANEAFYEPQNVYMEGNSKSEIMDKLRELGARRVLFVCNKSIASYKNYDDLIRKYESRGFRCFAYKKNDGPLTDIEILDGLKVYREYNCDTIVTIGGSYEIDLGKLISAMATNYCKSPSELQELITSSEIFHFFVVSLQITRLLLLSHLQSFIIVITISG